MMTGCKIFMERHPERSEEPALSLSKESQRTFTLPQTLSPFGVKTPNAVARPNALRPFVAALLRMTALGSVFALTGCKVTPPPKPLNQLTSTERAGHVAFQQNCARCHNDRETAPLQGPTMLSVYKNPYLPSGAPANDDRIRNVILHGRGMMPAVGYAMTSDQIDDLLAYLKTL